MDLSCIPGRMSRQSPKNNSMRSRGRCSFHPDSPASLLNHLNNDYSGCAPDLNPWPYGPPLSIHRHIRCWSYWLCIHQSHASYLYAVTVLRIRYRYALLCYKLRLKNCQYRHSGFGICPNNGPGCRPLLVTAHPLRALALSALCSFLLPIWFLLQRFFHKVPRSSLHRMADMPALI